MMYSKLINCVGLIIDIIGSLLLLKFGLPNRIDPGGHIHLIAEQVDKNEIRKAKVYKKWSSFSILLLILGFIMQLISNFL